MEIRPAAAGRKRLSRSPMPERDSGLEGTRDLFRAHQRGGGGDKSAGRNQW